MLFLCCVWLPRYLTIDSRSSSSPKESSCLDLFASEFDTDRAFFLLSAPANQSSSSSSSLFWLFETSGLVCLGILSVGAGVSVAIFAADVTWLPVKEGLLSSEGDGRAFGDSVEALVSSGSPSRKVGSLFVLRPSQSAELRCRIEAGFGFFSGVEELTSSVENLMIRIKKCSVQFSMADKKTPPETIKIGLHTHLTDCLRDWRPSGVDTSVG